MEISLSILIATMPSRKESFERLYQSLVNQGEFPDVEIIYDNSMEYNIGIKRNVLLSRAKGEYVVMADDDDFVSESYIESILNAIEPSPDCVAINGIITTNGYDKRKWFISKEYGHWFTGTDGTYYRTPNHISPVKRELALKAGFPNISFGEDSVYSQRLIPYLKTETIIEEPIYYYDYKTINK